VLLLFTVSIFINTFLSNEHAQQFHATVLPMSKWT